MILNRLELENFRSYANAEIEFSRGIYLILGENGSGKTTLFEAISFALFKEFTGTIDEVIRKGAGHLSVTLEFTSDGRSYRVVRTQKKKAADARLYLFEDGGEVLLTSGDRHVTAEIEEIVHLDRQMFLNAIYVRQGEIADLITTRSAERKKMVAKLLGIDALQTAWERMPAIIDEYTSRKIHIEGEVARTSEVTEEVRTREAAEAEAQSELARLKEDLEDAGERRDECRRMLEEYDEKWETFREADNRLRALRERLGMRERLLGERKRDLRRIEEAEKRVEEISEEISRREPLERLDRLLSVNLELKRECRNISAEIVRIRERWQDSISSVESEMERCSAILGERVSNLRDLENACNAALARIDEETKRAAEASRSLAAGISSSRGQCSELVKLRNQLASSDRSCPVCRTPLTAVQREELLERYDGQIKTIEASLLKMEEDLKERESHLADLNARSDRIRREVQIEYFREKIRSAGRIHEECEEKVRERDRLKSEILEAEEECGKIASLPGVSGTQELEEVREELRRMRETEAEYNRLKGQIQRKDEVSADIAGYGSEVVQLSEEMETAASLITRLSYDKKEHDSIREQVKEISDAFASLDRNAAALEAGIGGIRKRISELLEEKSRLEERAADLERLRSFISRLTGIREVFGKDGLQKELRLRARPVIEKHIRTFFADFNFEYSDIQLDDDYNVRLYGPAGETTVDMLSGGEKIAVAIAIRLGLAKALAGGAIETLMLDEPTIHLDLQRRKDLVYVFRRLGVIPQILIVTHDEDLEEVADTTVMIRKSQGVSGIEPTLP